MDMELQKIEMVYEEMAPFHSQMEDEEGGEKEGEKFNLKEKSSASYHQVQRVTLEFDVSKAS